MNVFIVFAHPEPNSLNGVLKDLAVLTLNENGHEVKVSDLYSMGFKATLDRDDFLKMQNQDRLIPMLEQFNASKTDGFSSDIKAEMEKIVWADLIIFQFPVWYETVPALLKAWFERVLAHGFAHNILEGKVFDRGFLKGKKAMLSFTGGSDKDSYYNNIPNNDKTKLLPPVTQVLRFTGMKVMDAFAIFNAVTLSEDDAEKAFEEYRKLLNNI